MSRKYISARLRELRTSAGLSTGEVGRLIGKAQATVSGWENEHGQPNIDDLAQLQNIYKVKNIINALDENIKVDEQDDVSEEERKYNNKLRLIERALDMIENL